MFILSILDATMARSVKKLTSFAFLDLAVNSFPTQVAIKVTCKTDVHINIEQL